LLPINATKTGFEKLLHGERLQSIAKSDGMHRFQTKEEPKECVQRRIGRNIRCI
jgi:hypothetical protein